LKTFKGDGCRLLNTTAENFYVNELKIIFWVSREHEVSELGAGQRRSWNDMVHALYLRFEDMQLNRGWVYHIPPQTPHDAGGESDTIIAQINEDLDDEIQEINPVHQTPGGEYQEINPVHQTPGGEYQEINPVHQTPGGEYQVIDSILSTAHIPGYYQILYIGIKNELDTTGSTNAQATVRGAKVFFYSDRDGGLGVIHQNPRVSDPHMNGLHRRTDS
jgi:hypothetical protein